MEFSPLRLTQLRLKMDTKNAITEKKILNETFNEQNESKPDFRGHKNYLTQQLVMEDRWSTKTTKKKKTH